MCWMVERHLLICVRVWAGTSAEFQMVSENQRCEQRWHAVPGELLPQTKGMKGGSSSRSLNRESYRRPLWQGGAWVYRPHIPLFLNFRFPARLPPDQIILKVEGEGASFPGQPPGTKSRSRKSREKLRGGMMEDQYSFNYEQTQLQMASPPKARW